ncbi:MAG TPA: four helix bundle protein [Polyangiaceae bacterium]|nr:four helix bundle protein [Polyangiaceae bacterium]
MAGAATEVASPSRRRQPVPTSKTASRREREPFSISRRCSPTTAPRRCAPCASWAAHAASVPVPSWTPSAPAAPSATRPSVRSRSGGSDYRECLWSLIRRYQQSRSFPADERFGLTSHLRKSATSIPSNIAEGCGREGERELARFLSIAAGSASESEDQLLVARDLRDLQPDVHRKLDDQVHEVKRMLNSFIKTLS